MRVAVIDIGKTNVKVALVDTATMTETGIRKMPNVVDRSGPYPHYRTEDHWDFILDALSALHPVDAISVAAHGATAALVDAAGDLVLPILDYEHPIDTADYDPPPFAETGSPRLGMGLNVGAQLWWQFRHFPQARRAVHVMTYPQYWTMRLTGVAACEATSIGCHTDLWRPDKGEPSSLVDRMGWRRLIPPMRRANEVLGPLRPDLAARTGLGAVPVTCGIHDSNASLYPHLLARRGAFSVVSTGTWVVCMAVGAGKGPLDPERDTLVNVDALGHPVPSARFMGGREYELVRAGRDLRATPDAMRRVLDRGVMLLPAVEPGSGPFRGHEARWTLDPQDEGEEAVALAFYLAMMTAECLSIIRAAGPVIVEGPFAANADYAAMLASATGREVEPSTGFTGTALGAALLAGPGPLPQPAAGIRPDPALAAYAAAWRSKSREGR